LSVNEIIYKLAIDVLQNDNKVLKNIIKGEIKWENMM